MAVFEIPTHFQVYLSDYQIVFDSFNPIGSYLADYSLYAKKFHLLYLRDNGRYNVITTLKVLCLSSTYVTGVNIYTLHTNGEVSLPVYWYTTLY